MVSIYQIWGGTMTNTYKARVGFGECHTYLTEIAILTIDSKSDGDFASYLLQYAGNSYAGSDLIELKCLLKTLTADLTTKSDYSRELLLVYVKNLKQIRAYFDVELEPNSRRLIIDNCEFRSWTDFTDSDVETVMQNWANIFADNKYPYLTPSQMPRKQLQKSVGDSTAHIFPSLATLPLISKGVHGGICYARDQLPHENMAGFDLVSAYIYSIVFKRHACEAPQPIDSSLWDAKINAEDYGTIGRYTIEYTCVFSAISCFKSTDGQSLRTGTHTVDIVLSNIDIQTLLSIPQMQIKAVDCKVLYGFKLDYLPKQIRDYCVELFIQKQTTNKKSADYIRIKRILNAGLFGNFLYAMNRIMETDRSERKTAYKRANKSLCPQWGIFTMAYVKQIIFGLGIKAVEWVYSDTDSIYCSNDSYNIKLFDDYNKIVYNQNLELCKQFEYSVEVAKLGTFDEPERIDKFIANKRKQYWYLTADGEIIVKAAGCDKSQFTDLDPDTIFSGSWIPPVGDRHYITYTKGKYFDRT